MLGIGFPELLIIAVVTVIAVGPQELPKVLRTVMTWTRKLRKLANEFQTGMEDLAREAELHELTKDIQKEVEDVTKGVTESVQKDMAEVEQQVAGTIESTGIEKDIAETQKELGGTFRVYDQYDELLDPSLVAGTSVFVPNKHAIAKEAVPEVPAAVAAVAPPTPAPMVAEAERITPQPVPEPAKPRIDA